MMQLINGCSRFALVALAATAGTAMADQPSAVQNSGVGSRYSLDLGVDWTTAYFFRGINQEDSGLIVQPYATLSVDLGEYEGGSFSGYLGVWNSIHSEDDTAGGGDTTSSFFETDFFVGFAASYDQFVFSLQYQWLTSPSSAFDTVEEITFRIEYDDSEAGLLSSAGLGEVTLNPHAQITFETGDDSAFGSDTGTYLELGIEPDVEIVDNGDFAGTSVSFPVVLGLDIGDYYDSTTGGDDDFFGFISFGSQLNVPLPIDNEWGDWSMTAGLTLLVLGDNLEDANSGDSAELIGNVGFGVSF